MCGRYELNATPLQLTNHFGGLLDDTEPLTVLATSYNIAPSTLQAVIRFGKQEGANIVDHLVWGFRPRWAKRAYINARSETLVTNSVFKESALTRRCLVIATGWYDWRVIDLKRKQPYYMSYRRPFAFGGIWTARKIGDAWEKSFAIVTAPANDVLGHVHDRMPLVLHPRVYSDWLSPITINPSALMQPLNNGDIEALPVSTLVNDPKNDSPECIARSGSAV